jgi:hypothetical protein
MILRYVIEIIPPSFFNILIPGIPIVDSIFFGYNIFSISLAWFFIGFFTWTLFVVFLTSIQAAGNAISFRPFESIKKYFEPAKSLVIRTSLVLTFNVAWLCPYLLVWTILPPDPSYREGMMMFVGSIVTIMTPIIILSLLLPILKVHKGLEDSKKRALKLKISQLEDLKKNKKTIPNYFEIQKHLIEDYEKIERNSEWSINAGQFIEIAGTILLPIATFFLSLAI